MIQKVNLRMEVHIGELQCSIEWKSTFTKWFAPSLGTWGNFSNYRIQASAHRLLRYIFFLCTKTVEVKISIKMVILLPRILTPPPFPPPPPARVCIISSSTLLIIKKLMIQLTRVMNHYVIKTFKDTFQFKIINKRDHNRRCRTQSLQINYSITDECLEISLIRCFLWCFENYTVYSSWIN